MSTGGPREGEEDQSLERLQKIAGSIDVHSRNEEVRRQIAKLLKIPLKDLTDFSADDLLTMKRADLSAEIEKKKSKKAS